MNNRSPADAAIGLLRILAVCSHSPVFLVAVGVSVIAGVPSKIVLPVACALLALHAGFAVDCIWRMGTVADVASVDDRRRAGSGT